MRCPICGTENAPDSRFCGGCGKQMPPPGKVAPTAKISDDAPLAPPTRQVSHLGPSGAPVSYAPPAMPTPPPGSLHPPQHYAPDSITPTVQRRAAPAQRSIAPPQPRPMASSPSLSYAAPPTRPLGLIALVLIIDLGLAGSGAFLLAKGLAKSEDKAAPAPVKPEQKSEAPAPAPAAPAAVAVAPAAAAAPAAVPEPSVPVPPPDVVPPAPPAPAAKTTAKPDPKSSAARRKDDKATGPVTSPSSGPSRAPTEPAKPAVVSIEAEIHEQAVQSRGAFKRCHEEAGTVQGSIVIAFQVMADGRVAGVAPVENTTSNGTLAYCLVTTIGAWKLSPHNGAPLAFVRPFSYP